MGVWVVHHSTTLQCNLVICPLLWLRTQHCNDKNVRMWLVHLQRWIGAEKENRTENEPVLLLISVPVNNEASRCVCVRIKTDFTTNIINTNWAQSHNRCTHDQHVGMSSHGCDPVTVLSESINKDSELFRRSIRRCPPDTTPDSEYWTARKERHETASLHSPAWQTLLLVVNKAIIQKYLLQL